MAYTSCFVPWWFLVGQAPKGGSNGVCDLIGVSLLDASLHSGHLVIRGGSARSAAYALNDTTGGGEISAPYAHLMCEANGGWSISEFFSPALLLLATAPFCFLFCFCYCYFLFSLSSHLVFLSDTLFELLRITRFLAILLLSISLSSSLAHQARFGRILMR